ncbi:MAG TPA: pilus assembly protein N-terminal domain-containing protein [Verrucomicrobiae bacterium]|nr:pilus assembly protein N-terminal domain-containing protein [Verrucomicrobiae bacterium]
MVLVFGILLVPPAQADTIQVNVGEAVTIPGENVSKIAIADPAVADVVPLSDKELSVIGKKAGVTTLTIVKSDGSATQLHRIEVGNDAVASTIRQMIGQSGVNVRAVGDTLVLDGRVENELQAQRAAQIASAYKDKVLNLIEVEKPRQIRIRTRVAEVNSAALKNVGFQWLGSGGEVRYALDFAGGGSIIHGLVQPESAGGPTVTQPNTVDIGADVILQLLITKNFARLLSEPTLVTLSGKEASFLVGEEVPIVQQLPQSFTVEFKEVGVRMNIKPTADSQNQINTVLHAEVSQVLGTGAFGIPIIGSKKADTTLQVKDGQTVVIGGLLENNINTDTLRKVPWLADIPLFGYLFRNRQFQQSQREVLFFMTPEIVKNVDAATAGAAQTLLMKEWVRTKSKEKLLKVTPLDELFPAGMQRGSSNEKAPAEKPSPVAQPAAKPAPVSKPAPQPAPAPKAAAAKPAAVEQSAAVEKPAPKKPAPAVQTEEPTTNFSPARPAGQ